MVVADTRTGDKPTDASVGSSAPVEAEPEEPPPVLTADNGAGYEGNEDPSSEAVRCKTALSRARRPGMQLPVTRRDCAPCHPLEERTTIVLCTWSFFRPCDPVLPPPETCNKCNAPVHHICQIDWENKHSYEPPGCSKYCPSHHQY